MIIWPGMTSKADAAFAGGVMRQGLEAGFDTIAYYKVTYKVRK